MNDLDSVRKRMMG